MVTLTRIKSEIEKNLQFKIDQTMDPFRAFLNTNIYRQYQAYQKQRWETQGASEDSEGKEWKELNPKYKEYKLKKFAKYPGAGEKMLVATNRLVKSVIGPSADHRKIVEGYRLVIQTTTPYAEYVNQVRDFKKFSDQTMKNIRQDIEDFLVTRAKAVAE